MTYKIMIKSCAVSIFALGAGFATTGQARMACDDELGSNLLACMGDVLSQIEKAKMPQDVDPIENNDGFVLSLDGYAVTADKVFQKQAEAVKDVIEQAEVTQSRKQTPKSIASESPSYEAPAPRDWFYFATADLTWSKTRIGGIRESQSKGRLAGYVDGTTAGGVQITASVDTGEEDFRDILRKLDRKDPQSVLRRLDPEDTYPTFGDDSSLLDNTPTSGRFYLKAQKGENFFLWGDYRSRLNGSKFIRNERELYGAQAHVETEQKTENGAARASLDLFVAQPDTQLGRDVFATTGGSVYFLKRQDVTVGTETISVQVRDAKTGRVLATTPLEADADYRINYFQGVVTLNAPLGDGAEAKLIETSAIGDTITNLIVQYEFTPTTSDTDTLAFGGRAEGWVTDKLRVGTTALSDETALGDNHDAFSADIRYQHSDTSFIQVDYAKSRGPGYAQSYSADGGFNIDNSVGNAGTGEAYNIEGQLDLKDINPNFDIVLGGYYQLRREGFATLDYQSAIGQGDRTLYGGSVEGTVQEALTWKLYADVEETNKGVSNKTVGAEVSGDLSETVNIAVAAERLNKNSNTRTTAKAKVTYSPSDALSYHVYTQNTLQDQGIGEYNRYGAGISAQLTKQWRVESDVSNGTGGLGGRLFAAYETEGNENYYFGYEIDPVKNTDAGFNAKENGKFVLGGRRQVNDNVAVFGENSYDIFGARRTFSSQYGVDYQPTERMTYSFATQLGRVVDDGAGDTFDRYAYSFGAQYAGKDIAAKGRLEYRHDTGATSVQGDSDTFALSAELKQKFSETARVVATLDAIETRANQGNISKGTYIDGVLGYAFRPVDNDKLNMLLRYRFVYDMYGQTIDGQADNGPRQRSHVFSVDADYDVDQNWTVGGKLGYRLAMTSADSISDFSRNNAGLAVVNARYHLVGDWDLLVENRTLWQEQTKTTKNSTLTAAYRHLGNNVKLGVGYNFGTFSDDLNDLVHDDNGVFINMIAKF